MGESQQYPDFLKRKNETGTEDTFFYVGYEGLPAEFLTKAEQELSETEEKRIKGTRRLREFIKKENYPCIDDMTLLTILRGCKYNLKKSESKLKKYIKIRQMVVERLSCLDLATMEEILSDRGIGILPYRDKHGRVIFYTRPEAMNDCSYSMDSVILTGLTCVLFLMEYPITSVAGAAYIGGCNFTSAASYLSLLKAIHHYLWSFLDLPIRIGIVVVLQEHFLTRWFFKIISPFLSSKVLDRVNFTGPDQKNLLKHFHPDILPEEFGGNMGPLDHTFYKDIALNAIKKLKAEVQIAAENDK